MSSKVTGKVLEVFVEEGQAVKRGQVLARLDDSQLRARARASPRRSSPRRSGRRRKIEARLREAELTLGRRQQLVKDKVISRAELESPTRRSSRSRRASRSREQQVEVAQSQVDARRTDLDDMVVRGAVRRRGDLEGRAAGRDDLAGVGRRRLHAHRHLHDRGHVVARNRSRRQRELHQPRQRRQPVEAVLDAYPDWRIPAHVITTVPSADRQKSTVRVRIGFDKLDPRILPDMGVKASFLAERPVEAAKEPARPRILVPKAAVRTIDGAVGRLRGARAIASSGARSKPARTTRGRWKSRRG